MPWGHASGSACVLLELGQTPRGHRELGLQLLEGCSGITRTMTVTPTAAVTPTVAVAVTVPLSLTDSGMGSSTVHTRD